MLHDKIKELIELKATDDENSEKLHRLYQLGVIYIDGNYINNDMK